MNKKTKYIIAGIIFLFGCSTLAGLILFLTSGMYTIYSASNSTAEYFITVSELQQKQGNVVGKPVRVSGAVIGESIGYDKKDLTLTFTIADVPANYTEVEELGGLVKVLEDAVNDLARPRLQIFYIGEKPELLRHMAQAIITGKLSEDGIFYAEEILLRCPSRYEEAVPDQAVE